MFYSHRVTIKGVLEIPFLKLDPDLEYTCGMSSIA